MDIKSLGPNKNFHTKQGIFPIKDCKKYFGTGPIIYRSSWEYKFCVWAEKSPDVVRWSSESIEISYWNKYDGKYSNYYPDFFIELSNGKKFVIEVKPRKDIIKPTKPKTKSKKAYKNYNYSLEQYIKNMCKFQAAIKYCKNRGFEFKIVDESWFKSL